MSAPRNPGIDRRAPCPCGSGRRYKSCCQARDQSLREARQGVLAGHERIDAAVRVMLPVVQAAGHTVACQAGCSACCESLVRITYAEALVVADFLAQPEQAAARGRFLAQLPLWQARAGDAPERLALLLEEGRGQPAEGPIWDAYNEATQAYQRKRNPCPLNHEGRCDVYPARPVICRAVFVADTSEYCAPDRGRMPTNIQHAGLDQAVREVSPANLALSARAGEATRRPLPLLVAKALAQVMRGLP